MQYILRDAQKLLLLRISNKSIKRNAGNDYFPSATNKKYHQRDEGIGISQKGLSDELNKNWKNSSVH